MLGEKIKSWANSVKSTLTLSMEMKNVNDGITISGAPAAQRAAKQSPILKHV